MYKHSILLLSFVLSIAIHSNGQGIAAYNDYRQRFHIFYQGIYQQIEHMPVLSYQQSGDAIAYVDNTNQFKIWHGGKVIDPKIFAQNFKYEAGRHMIAFSLGRILWSFENGMVNKLSNFAPNYFMGDSVLAYYDETMYSLMAIYHNEKIELDAQLVNAPQSVKAGINTLAWVNGANFFKVFWSGQVHELENMLPESFAAGGDLVAYVDGYQSNFKMFYEGKVGILETFRPLSYKVGNRIAAYVNQQDELKIFQNGATSRLLSFAPDYYEVVGNMIIYANLNQWHVYYKGEDYLLEEFMPSKVVKGFDGLAWLDNKGWLKYFDHGKIYTVSYEQVKNFVINGDVLKYEIGNNTNHFYWKGQNY
ncbi:MAG: hypothetical protein RIQ89_1902 [Bacteroidota bacterium]